ncbi:MAG: hypothetical protein K1X35_11255 [Caulobacteraceae bacterium]|nr:hypothetical protein [Caulobacteraceae bacterium]
MKKTLALAAVVATATLMAGQAEAQDYRAAAQRDLQAAHDLLRDNHPAANVDKDSAQFRSWLDTGLAQAMAGLPKVQGELAYENIMRFYLTGFRDTNISFIPGYAELPGYFAAFWPGFSTRWVNGGYTVAWARAGDTKIPPVGARLVSCDRKTADQVAVERLDRYEGDMTQAVDRARTAPYLFWDRGNPFTAALPQKCVFRVGTSNKTYTMNYQPSAEAERRAAYMAGLGKPQGGPTMEAWNGGYWLRLPTFTEGAEWDAFLAQLDGQLAQVQAAPVIVLDMRGANDAPTSRNGYKLANRLWGPDFILANQPQVGNAAYRVSAANRAVYADAVNRMKSDPLSYYQVPIWEKMLQEFDAALAAGQPLLQRNESKAPSGAAPPSALRGRVIVLTDAYCAAQCLALMDLFTRLPGVVHAGSPTSGDSIFVGQTVSRLPSNEGSISFGNKAWLDRPRASGAGFTPTAPYNGDPADENAVRAFVQGLANGAPAAG